MRALIIGAGGAGQMVADIFRARLKGGDESIQVVGYLDDDPALQHRSFLDLPVLGTIAQASCFAHEVVVVTIGDNSTRRRISQQLQARGEQFVSAIHPTAVVGAAVGIGAGTIICAGAVVNTGSQIGRGGVLSACCAVSHHNHLEDYVHVALGAHLAGHVKIGGGALVGVGAAVIPGCSIGDWAIVGAGAVVTKDIPANTTAVGVPARVIKTHKPR